MLVIGPFAILLLLIVIAVVVAVMNSTFKSSEDGQPRGFPWLLMLFGGVVVAGIVVFIISQSRPATYVLDVSAASGKPFLGEVIVDGRRQVIDGEGNKSFEFTGRTIRWRVLIDDESGAESISVQLTGRPGGGSTSNWGAAGSVEKHFFSGSGRFTSISEDEWRQLMPELKSNAMPGNSLLPGVSGDSNPVSGEPLPESTTAPDGDGPEATPTDSECAAFAPLELITI